MSDSEASTPRPSNDEPSSRFSNSDIPPPPQSPRRDSEETNKLAEDAREALREHAKASAASLLEIAESIELVRSDYEKLEKQNLALQDYIGGLTRSMAKGDLNVSASSSGKAKGKGGKKVRK